MLGRVYTFERESGADAEYGLETVAASAVNAITAAINDQPGIRYEELTDGDNARPVIVVLFAGPKQMDYFDELLEAALRLSAVRARVVHDTGPHGNVNGELIAQPPPQLPEIDLSRLRRIVPTRAA